MTASDRARAYLRKLPPAISGQGGHASTFAAACRLAEFGVAQSEALEILSEWNRTHCQPPWTEHDLRHKLADAYRRTAPKESFTRGPQHQNWRCRSLPASRAPSLGGAAVTRAQNPRVSTADTKSKRPITDPSASVFDETPREGQFSALATLRGISVEGVKLAYDRGLLRFGTYHKRHAWFTLDQSDRVAQARRMDGKPWPEIGGKKAWTLPGSQAKWPVGIDEASNFPAIALVEGGPDLLAVCALLLAEGRERDVAPVAMLGGLIPIHGDALIQFDEKRVRIFPHVDETGDTAANRWAEQLANAGATVDAFSLSGLHRSDGSPVKDLCDLAAINADDFDSHPCLCELFNL